MSEAVVRSPSQLCGTKEAYINFTLARLERDYRLNRHCEGIGWGSWKSVEVDLEKHHSFMRAARSSCSYLPCGASGTRSTAVKPQPSPRCG